MGNKIKQLVVIVVASSLLGACAARYEMKAPCDPTQCKNRVKVNTWPSK